MLNAGELVDGRFRIEQQVGAGGMGIVYRARDEQLGDTVAIKLIHTNTAEEIWRATREIEVLTKLAHPGIVRHVADGLTATDQLYLAMEWIDGVTVADRLDNDGFSLREAVTLAAGVAHALGAAHAEHILHRDIKPTNVMLVGGDPARPKLIDFGMARLLSQRGVTRDGLAVGTPGYMSPEQARGIRSLTAASDVFGLGLVLYECATGRPAFTAATHAALLMNIVLAEPTPLVEYCPEAPAALGALVARMLDKDPDARPADGHAAAAELDHLGMLPDAPRRDGHQLVDGKTRVTPVGLDAHCLVLAARGLVEDTLEPPDPQERMSLVLAARSVGAQLELLANGVVVAHFEGPLAATATRAADYALVVKSILPRWTVAISTMNPELSAAAEEGTALLIRATKAAIFARSNIPEGIALDPHTASLLETGYLVHPGSPPRLFGKRR